MATIELDIDMEYGRRERVEFIGERVTIPVVNKNADGTRHETYVEYSSEDGHHVRHIEQWGDDQSSNSVCSSIQLIGEAEVEPWPIVDKTTNPNLKSPLTLDQALTYSCIPQSGWLD
jgi:hypothetical protein